MTCPDYGFLLVILDFSAAVLAVAVFTVLPPGGVVTGVRRMLI